MSIFHNTSFLRSSSAAVGCPGNLREHISNISQDVTLHDLRLSPAEHDYALHPRWAQTHATSPKYGTQIPFVEEILWSASRMSGIEIVGIVLGALPIMVSGIERYSEGLSVARRLLHPRRELRNLHRAIRTELQVFRNTALLLLHRIATESEVETLVREPSSQLWRAPGFENHMKTLLGSSYSVWCEVMADISNAITDISMDLGLPLDKVRFDKPLSVILAHYTTSQYDKLARRPNAS